MSTQIRIAVDVKKELEDYRDSRNHYRVKTHSDAISDLINNNSILHQKNNELEDKIEENSKNNEMHFVYLGEELKGKLENMCADLSINNISDLVDLLYFNWHASSTLDKCTVDYYLKICK